MDWSIVGLLRNLKIHIESYYKLFIGTKSGLKNEMIKFKCEIIFLDTLTKW
jgi:hypothetical protein